MNEKMSTFAKASENLITLIYNIRLYMVPTKVVSMSKRINLGTVNYIKQYLFFHSKLYISPRQTSDTNSS